jgi:predicted P-loop ATPase/GTPase
MQRINKTKSWFFEKVKKIYNPLDTINKGHRKSIKMNKIRNEKGDIKRETEEIKKIVTNCYKSLWSTKLKNLDEMDDFLDIYNVQKLN